MGSILILLIAATIVEKIFGTDFAVRWFYTAPWTIALWAVAVVAGMAYIIHERKYKQINVWVFLLHCSFPVILAGAMLTHVFGREGALHLRIGEYSSYFSARTGEEEQMPFAVMLEDFDVICYPGTKTPEDFVSKIQIISRSAFTQTEEDGGVKSFVSSFVEGFKGAATSKDFGAESTIGLSAFTPSAMMHFSQEEIVASGTVAMNKIFRYKGWRLYQSQYDEDMQGCTFLVSYDPVGIAVTYAGYLLLLVSVCLYLLFGHRHHSHEAHQRHHHRHTHDYIGRTKNTSHLSMSVLAVLITLSIAPFAASAAPQALQQPVAETFGDLLVEYNGRVCPMSTLATDVTLKLYGKPYWKAEDGTRYTANQVLTGLLFYYDDWAEVPLKHSRKPAANKEREMVRLMVANGSLFKIWPTADGWLDINLYTKDRQTTETGLPQEELLFRTYALQYVAHDLMQGKNVAANETLKKIRKYQIDCLTAIEQQSIAANESEKRETVAFSERRFQTEQLFRQINYTKPLAITMMMLGLLFFAVYCFLRAKGRHVPRWLGYVMAIGLIVAWLFLTAMLSMRWYVSGHVPMSNGHETMQTLAWFAMLLSVCWSLRSRSVLPYGYLVSAMALMVSMMTASNPQITHLMPVLQSPLLSMHVGVIMLAYAFLAFVMFNAIAALFMNELEQHRMRHVSEKLLRPGVCLLAIGIFLGAVWANISWGRYWGWDPKEVWALITLLVYAAPLHKRSLPVFQNVRFFHIYTIVAFLSVLITYFGVNFFLGGMHSYA